VKLNFLPVVEAAENTEEVTSKSVCWLVDKITEPSEDAAFLDLLSMQTLKEYFFSSSDNRL